MFNISIRNFNKIFESSKMLLDFRYTSVYLMKSIFFPKIESFVGCRPVWAGRLSLKKDNLMNACYIWVIPNIEVQTSTNHPLCGPCLSWQKYFLTINSSFTYELILGRSRSKVGRVANIWQYSESKRLISHSRLGPALTWQIGLLPIPCSRLPRHPPGALQENWCCMQANLPLK